MNMLSFLKEKKIPVLAKDKDLIKALYLQQELFLNLGTNFWLRLLFGWIKFLESKKKKIKK